MSEKNYGLRILDFGFDVSYDAHEYAFQPFNRLLPAKVTRTARTASGRREAKANCWL